MTHRRDADTAAAARGSLLDRVAGQRVRLQAVADALAQSLDPEAVASQILHGALSVLGAPQGWVAALTDDGDAVELLAHAGYPPEAVAPWTRVPLAAAVPMTEVVRTGRPLFHRTGAERRADFPALAAPSTQAASATDAAGATRTEGSAVVPLGFEGRPMGALAISFPEPRTLDDDERWFLSSLAAQGSQALERARLFAQLQERETRLRFTLEASATGTWEWDLRHDRLEWSPQTLRMHGLGDGPAPRPAAWMAMVDEADRPLVRREIRACVRSGETRDVEFRVHLPDGSERWIHAAGRLLRGTDGRPGRILGTARDITPRKRVEAERDRLLEAEREAGRLRDAFIGVVSHELRTPITTIFAGTRVLARRWRAMDDAARDGILGDIVEESDRLYRLVEDLLVLTRVERGTLDVGDEPIHVGRTVERVLASEAPRWPEVRFEAELPPGLPSAAGEETYVEQVLRNLLGNAAKYGGPGSRVTVRADAERDEIVLTVLDEGPGFDPDEAEQLFELFYRAPATASAVSGAGIGLFVCRQLVSAMGGSIVARRRADRGAAFVVCLPQYRDDDAG